MKNIYNYIEKYQNQKIDKITTVDAMVFARLAYVHLENIKDRLPLTIKDLAPYLEMMKTNSKDKKLVEMLAQTKRFQDIIITRLKNVLDEEKEEQFFGVTFSYNNYLFIAFRGTNKNIIAYKEDLNMSYMTIPSQKDALDYLNSEKKICPIYLMGHSKGGNLAMYAGINTNTIKRHLIQKIYNFDGPGFLELNKKFYTMRKKILNYGPENNIVSMLMYNDNTFNSIVSDKKGIEAHNMYHWSIINDDLELGALNPNSQAFHYACIHLLDKIDVQKRKVIINHLFKLIIAGKIKKINELKIEDIREYITLVPKISSEDKDELMSFMKSFLKCIF